MKRTSRARLAWGFAVLTGIATFGAGAWWGLGSGSSPADAASVRAGVDGVAGFTKIGTTEDYVVVVNVLPAERMFTADELASQHPTEGEAVLRGPANAVLPSGRHIEAHIYDRTTGVPTTSVTPSIVLTVQDVGTRIVIEPTLMQDVGIGAADVHFGNNAMVEGGHDVSVRVDIAGQEVVIDGHLD